MIENPVQRHLTAILLADVAGYSQLMGEDDEGTLAALTRHFAELVEPRIAVHRGRVVKATGGCLLAEFASVVDAVRCSAEMQSAVAERNAGVAEDRRIACRVGVNLGDLLIHDGDVYGDGVGVAARLGTMAEPGGICVSGNVFEQVEGKLDLRFDYLGALSLKSNARPLRVYASIAAADQPMPGSRSPRRRSASRTMPPRRRRWWNVT